MQPRLCSLPAYQHIGDSVRGHGENVCLASGTAWSVSSLNQPGIEWQCKIHGSGICISIVQPVQSQRGSVKGSLGSDLSWPTMQEVRIEDCTSDSSAEPAPWEDTMRLMPPLLELADMFNIILRRCRNSRADSDLVRGAPPQHFLKLFLMLHMCHIHSCMAAWDELVRGTLYVR